MRRDSTSMVSSEQIDLAQYFRTELESFTVTLLVPRRDEMASGLPSESPVAFKICRSIFRFFSTRNFDNDNDHEGNQGPQTRPQINPRQTEGSCQKDSTSSNSRSRKSLPPTSSSQNDIIPRR